MRIFVKIILLVIILLFFALITLIVVVVIFFVFFVYFLVQISFVIAKTMHINALNIINCANDTIEVRSNHMFIICDKFIQKCTNWLQNAANICLNNFVISFFLF